MLYRSTDRLRRCGAPVQYLSHSASFHSLEKYAPPNAGTKHLVTQGTVANWNLGQLIGPTLQGLSEEKDLLVLVTTGKPAEDIPVDIPANARIAPFLPYEQVLPKIDLLITYGGYGTVNTARAQGVPIVSAGLTEDKEEVSANLQWSGGGIDLRTNEPSPEAVRTAARKILGSFV